MNVPAAGYTRSALLATSARDVEISVKLSTDRAPSGYGEYAYLVARRDANGNEYRLTVRLSGSSVLLSAASVVAGRALKIGPEVVAPGVAYAVGAKISVRVDVAGTNPTTLRMKAWPAASTQPSGWAYSATDSTVGLQVAGGTGLRSYLGSNTSNVPVKFSYDDYLVTQVSTSAPPPGAYVSKSGADTNAGTYASPWRTLQHAADVATGVVNVRGGTYAGFTVRRSGVTFDGYPGETAVVSGGVNVIDVENVSSATFRDLTVTGAVGPMGAGFVLNKSSNVVIDGNVIYNNVDYGIRTWYSTNTIIKNNEIRKNMEGMRISYTAGGTQILNNQVHDNDRMIDPTKKDAGGGVGIAFLKTTGNVLAQGNQLWKNRAADSSYGYDGGAFEIFGASDVTITGNTMWDNKDVLETGTTTGFACKNIKFTRNIGYAASTAPGYARGMIIACMSNSLVANNTLSGFDQDIISIVNVAGYTYQGSLDGLKLRNNILVSDGKPLYYLDNVPSTVSVDRDILWNRNGTSMAYIPGTGTVSGLANLRTVTGFEKNGFAMDPKFTDFARNNFHLASGSPAVDQGWTLSGVTDGFLGAAPDVGRYEDR
jgi:parallel beta-helix repeat protein